MKNKKIIGLIFLVIVSIMGVAITISIKNSNNSTYTEEKATISKHKESLNDEMFDVSIVADMAFELDTVEKISDMATVMVKGEVVDTNTFTINNNDDPQVVTLVKVKVGHDYKGKIEDNKEIYFIQHGGIVKVKDLQISKKNFEGGENPDPEKLAKVTLNGVDVAEKGDKVLFFAVPINDDFYNLKLKEVYYETVGDYQGRFNLNEDTNEFVRQEPIDTNEEENIQKLSVPSKNTKQKITILNNEKELEKVS